MSNQNQNPSQPRSGQVDPKKQQQKQQDQQGQQDKSRDKTQSGNY